MMTDSAHVIIESRPQICSHGQVTDSAWNYKVYRTCIELHCSG